MGNRRKQSLATKFAVIFIIFGVISMMLIGLSVYINETKIHIENQLREVKNVNAHMHSMIMDNSERFYTFVKLLPEYADQMHIPFELTEYNTAYHDFVVSFAAEYPGMTFEKDIFTEDLKGRALLDYLEFNYIYWTLTFREARDEFGLRYLYIITPYDDGTAAYIVDVWPTEKENNPKEMIVYYFDSPEDNDEKIVPIMWETWRRGEELDKFQIWNNEYGNTYSYYSPIRIRGEKLGMIVGEVDIDKVNKIALTNALIIIAAMAAVYVPSCIAMYWIIRMLYVKKLMKINEDVGEFAKTKDYSIADRIEATSSTVSEIDGLSKQISVMIRELKQHFDSYSEIQGLYQDSMAREAVANQLATRDSLTGALNKTAYDSFCENVNEMIAGGNKRFCVVMIDLNFLKKINDEYGHARGNAALMNLYELISDHFPSDRIFRIGGDEFVVILDSAECDRVAERETRFKADIAALSKDTSRRPWNRTSAAVGVAFFDPRSDKSIDDTFKRADMIMYENKKLMKGIRED